MAADDEVFGRSSRFIFHWFLQEQREEVASMSALLSVVERAADSILLAEEYLARQQIGDAVVDPTAPPAAGGAL